MSEARPSVLLKEVMKQYPEITQKIQARQRKK